MASTTSMMRSLPLRFCIGVIASALVWMIAYPALACSWANDAAARAHSVTSSNYYWAATGLLGCIVIVLELRRRWLSVIMGLAALLVVFHPAWTLRPNYGPDCSFQNVEASQYDFIIICILLIYQLVRYLRTARRQH